MPMNDETKQWPASMFDRIEQFRQKTGRDLQTGRRVNRKAAKADPQRLIVIALRMAATSTTRDDLRPQYIELADFMENHE